MVEYNGHELIGALHRNHNWTIISNKVGNWDFGDGNGYDKEKKYIHIVATTSYFSTNQINAISKYLKNTPKDWVKEINITPINENEISINLFCLLP